MKKHTLFFSAACWILTSAMTGCIFQGETAPTGESRFAAETTAGADETTATAGESASQEETASADQNESAKENTSVLTDWTEEYYRFSCHPDSQTVGRPNYLINMDQTLYLVSQFSLSEDERDSLSADTASSVGKIQQFCEADQIPWENMSANLPLPAAADPDAVTVSTTEQDGKSYLLLMANSQCIDARQYTLARLGLLLSCQEGEWTLSKDWVYVPESEAFLEEFTGEDTSAANSSSLGQASPSLPQLAADSYRLLLQETDDRYAPQLLMNINGTIFELDEEAAVSPEELGDSSQTEELGEISDICQSQEIPLEDMSMNWSPSWAEDGTSVTVSRIAKGAQDFLLFKKDGTPMEGYPYDTAVFPAILTYQDGIWYSPAPIE